MAATERPEIVRGDAPAGLLLHQIDHIPCRQVSLSRYREAPRLESRLQREATNDIRVAQGEIDQFTQLIFIDARNNGHRQYHGDSLPTAVLKGLEFIGQQVRTPQRAGDVGSKAVELQVDFTEPRFL